MRWPKIHFILSHTALFYLNRFGYNMLEFLSSKKFINLLMTYPSYSFLFPCFLGLRRKSIFGILFSPSLISVIVSLLLLLLSSSSVSSSSVSLKLVSISHSRELFWDITIDITGDFETKHETILIKSQLFSIF